MSAATGVTAGQYAIENMRFNLTDHVHFTGFAIELQRQDFIAMDQLHITDLGSHTRHTLSLLRTQVERKAQAVLGDHHRYVTRFLVSFKCRFNQLHTKAFVKGARLFVIHVIEEGQLSIGIHRGRITDRFTHPSRVCF